MTRSRHWPGSERILASIKALIQAVMMPSPGTGGGYEAAGISCCHWCCHDMATKCIGTAACLNPEDWNAVARRECRGGGQLFHIPDTRVLGSWLCERKNSTVRASIR